MIRVPLDEIAEAIKNAMPANTMKEDHRWCNGCNSARNFIARDIARNLYSRNKDFDARAFLKTCGADPNLFSEE